MLLEWSTAERRIDNHVTSLFVLTIDSLSDGVHVAANDI